MEEWRGWEEGFELEMDRLPPLGRLAQDDEQGVGFTFTDESDPDGRVRMVFVSADEGTMTSVEKPYDEYLQLAAHAAVYGGSDGLYETRVYTRPELPSLAADTPFPTLVPGMKELAAGVWSIGPDFTRAVSTGRVVFNEFRSVFAWLRDSRLTATIESIRLPDGPPGRQHPLTTSAEVLAARLHDRITLPSDDELVMSGTISTIPVIIAPRRDGTLVLAHSAQFDGQLDDVLRGWGWTES
jgi:hypothetical protein